MLHLPHGFYRLTFLLTCVLPIVCLENDVLRGGYHGLH